MENGETNQQWANGVVRNLHYEAGKPCPQCGDLLVASRTADAQPLACFVLVKPQQPWYSVACANRALDKLRERVAYLEATLTKNGVEF